MLEMVCNKSINLYELPHGEDLWGVVFPSSGRVNKDGLAVLRQRDAVMAANLFKCNRKLGAYFQEWGDRVFYLGTYSNRSGGVFRLFNFPEGRDGIDMTTITKSAEDLVALCNRYGVKHCLIPCFVEDFGAKFYFESAKNLLSLIFDDRFIMVLRRDV